MHRSILAGLVAVALLIVGAPSPVAAADDIPTSATTTYRVVPEKGHIQVTVVLKVTNKIASTTKSYDCPYEYWSYETGWTIVSRTCSSTTRYYVNEAWVWVEAAAKDLKVTSDAGSVKLTKDKGTDSFRSYKVTFPRIYKGKTRTITATYTIPGGAPRSATEDRVNQAYVNFWAFSQFADTAKVVIKVPRAFDVDTTGGNITEKVSGDDRILSTGAVDDPAKFYVGISGTNASGFVLEKVATGNGRVVSILGWPGDTEWMSAVRGEAATAIPALEALIGRPLPGSGEIVVRETSDAALGYAYIGTYDPDEQLARVSEDFSQTGTVAHELSHAWFNDSLFSARWLAEGYAGWIEEASGTVSSRCSAPGAYPGDGNPSISYWRYAEPRATEAQLSVIDYQYDAACYLVTEAADEIGVDRMRDVIEVLATPESAYRGVSDRVAGAAVGWRDWLDALDERGLAPGDPADAEAVADLLVQYGIATEKDLAPRSAARAALRDLRDSTSGWSVPVAVLRPMAYWAFDDAQAAIATANETIELSSQVETLLPSVAADTGPIREAYEGATEEPALSAVHDQAADQLVAASAVADAIAAAAIEPGPLERIGLLGTDVPVMTASAIAAVAAMDLAGATAQAQAVHAVLDEAPTNGMIRTAIVVGILLALVLVAWLLRRRLRRRPRLAVAAATAEVAGAAEVAPDVDAATSGLEPGAGESAFDTD